MHVRFPEGQIDVVVIVLINLIFEHICCVNKALLYTYTISSLSSLQVLLSNILLFWKDFCVLVTLAHLLLLHAMWRLTSFGIDLIIS